MIASLKQWYRRYLSDSQAAFLAGLLVVGFAVVILMGDLLLPVFASIVIAYLLDDVVERMQAAGSRHLTAVLLVYLAFLALLVFVLFGLVPLLSAQVSQLVQELPRLIGRGQEALMRLPQHYPFITERQVEDIMQAIGTEVGHFGRAVLATSLSSLTGIVTMIVYVVLFPLLVFFFLKDKHAILAWFGRFLPARRGLMQRVWREMDRQIGNYVRGKIWEIVIVGGVSSAAFLFLGLNYAILLGALVGLSVIVPYVGATVVTVPVLAIGYLQWGWGSEFVAVAVVYGVIQALDAVVLVPLLFSEAVNLHPIAIIVAILIFGGWWGFWGVFFAIPLATLVQVILNAWPRTPAAAPRRRAARARPSRG
jgi:putative permease